MFKKQGISWILYFLTRRIFLLKDTSCTNPATPGDRKPVLYSGTLPQYYLPNESRRDNFNPIVSPFSASWKSVLGRLYVHTVQNEMLNFGRGSTGEGGSGSFEHDVSLYTRCSVNIWETDEIKDASSTPEHNNKKIN